MSLFSLFNSHCFHCLWKARARLTLTVQFLLAIAFSILFICKLALCFLCHARQCTQTAIRPPLLSNGSCTALQWAEIMLVRRSRGAGQTDEPPITARGPGEDSSHAGLAWAGRLLRVTQACHFRMFTDVFFFLVIFRQLNVLMAIGAISVFDQIREIMYL